MTLCNLSIECGARCGMVAPDATTIEHVRGRPFAPSGAEFERAADTRWRCAGDPDAEFERVVTIRGAEIAPTVTWGTSPEDNSADRRCRSRSGALKLDTRSRPPASATRSTIWALHLGMRLADIAIDRAFIGSVHQCADIEDLHAAGRHPVGPQEQGAGAGFAGLDPW